MYTSFTAGGNPAQYQQATFYSYDPHGNVDTLLQDYGNSTYTAAQNLMNTNGARFKKLVYRYDLISGKVNHVSYQAREADQFYHRYGYDAENRLTMTETSTDSVHWQKDARYTYYKHGPLARTVLGEDQVQGTDYAYTLQGWLKGTNSTSLSPGHDMGGDGNGPHTAGQYIARDAMGFALHYYDNDYKAIGTGVTPFPGLAGYLGGDERPLYNGNINSMAVHIGALPGAVLYNYEYDRLNRITGMDMWKGFNPSGNDWTAITVSTDYKERVAYDPNGNILQYLRNTAGTTTAMDSMRYHYYAGTNRLSHIKDNAPSGIEYNDIEDQIASNYAYDAIGNLTSDSSEHISRIDWNVYGKITGITRSTPSAGSNTRQINYRYDAAGNRIGKKTAYFGTSEVSHTWYVRDASGNVMAVYTAKKDTASSAALPDFALTLSEQHVYGSSRLGIQRRKVDMEGSFIPGQVISHVQGEKSFELSNHLGNVLTTISDRKKGVARTDSSSLISYYKVDVQTAQDYYPFGMLMPGRSGYQTKGGWAQGNQTVNGTSLPELLTLESRENDMPPEYKATREVVFTGEYVTGTGDEFLAYIADATNTGTGSGEVNGQGVVQGYPFGFGSQRMSDEIKGHGNSYTADFWEYDPRIGRRWNVDPILKEYESPYATFGNNPIIYIDPSGADTSLPEHVVIGKKKPNGRITLDEIPTERIGKPSALGTAFNAFGGSTHRQLAQAFGYGRQDQSGIIGVAIFDFDDFNTIVTSYKQGEVWNEASNDWEKRIFTSYSIFRSGIEGSMSLDVSEADFFANPSGYLRPSSISFDPTMALGGKGGAKGLAMMGARASGLATLRYASKLGIQAYSALKGKVSGAQVHHLIEQRFERLFPGLGKTTTWSSIVLTKAEHIKFNTAWRMEIGLRNWKSKITTVNATKQDVINAAQRIYKDYPEIIELIKKL